MNSIATIFFDGGSRGNPGLAAGGAIINYNNQNYCADEFIKHATNNQAKYTGCIVALKKALELGANTIQVYGDSKLVIEQVNGNWNIKANHLFNLCLEVQSLAQKFKSYSFSFQWIPRDQNSEADSVCNQCLDKHTGIDLIRAKSASLALHTPQSVPNLNPNPNITALINLGEDAKFKDFMSLKSGKDKFSNISLETLIKAVFPEVWQLVQTGITEGDEW